MVRAWKLCASCCLLPKVGIDLLLDPCVLDWNDFYLSCLESISKHCGTNLKYACERSYDKINRLKSLSDWLMKDRPGFIVGESRLKENKWQKYIKVLIFEFQQHIDNHLLTQRFCQASNSCEEYVVLS